MSRATTRPFDVDAVTIDSLQNSREFCVEYLKSVDEEMVRLRNAALEEAAGIADKWGMDYSRLNVACVGKEIASSIRSLKKETGE